MRAPTHKHTHAHAHTHARNYAHIHRHTHTQAHTHTHMHAHRHTHTHASTQNIHTRVRTHTRMCTHTHAPKNAHSCTHASKHTHIRTHTKNTHTHTYTHTYRVNIQTNGQQIQLDYVQCCRHSQSRHFFLTSLQLGHPPMMPRGAVLWPPAADTSSGAVPCGQLTLLPFGQFSRSYARRVCPSLGLSAHSLPNSSTAA